MAKRAAPGAESPTAITVTGSTTLYGDILLLCMYMYVVCHVTLRMRTTDTYMIVRWRQYVTVLVRRSKSVSRF